MNGSTNAQWMDSTHDAESTREKRKHPRFYLNLPIEFRMMDASYVCGAMVVNASETGLLIRSLNNIPIGTRLKIAVLFSKGFEFGKL